MVPVALGKPGCSTVISLPFCVTISLDGMTPVGQVVLLSAQDPAKRDGPLLAAPWRGSGLPAGARGSLLANSEGGARAAGRASETVAGSRRRQRKVAPRTVSKAPPTAAATSGFDRPRETCVRA